MISVAVSVARSSSSTPIIIIIIFIKILRHSSIWDWEMQNKSKEKQQQHRTMTAGESIITRLLVKELARIRERQVPRLRDFLTHSAGNDQRPSCIISGQKMVRDYITQRCRWLEEQRIKKEMLLSCRSAPRRLVCHESFDMETLFSHDLVDSAIDGVEVYHASESDLKRITGLQRMSQVNDMVCMEVTLHADHAVRTWQSDELTCSKVRSWCIMHELQDPGNLGTLVRTAYGIGVNGILLSSDCVSPFSDKTLRASRGISLDENLNMTVYGDLDALLTSLEQRGYNVLIASMPRESEGVTGDRHLTLGRDSLESVTRRPWCLLLSNEFHGIPDDKIRAWKSQHSNIHSISIPMMHNVESINVSAAGAILLSHLALCRQQ